MRLGETRDRLASARAHTAAWPEEIRTPFGAALRELSPVVALCDAMTAVAGLDDAALAALDDDLREAMISACWHIAGCNFHGMRDAAIAFSERLVK